MTKNINLEFLDPFEDLIVLDVKTDYSSNIVRYNGWTRKRVGRVIVNNHLYLLSADNNGQIIYDGETRMPFWTIADSEVRMVANSILSIARTKSPSEHVLFKTIFRNIWEILEKRGLDQEDINNSLKASLKKVEAKYGERPND